MADPVRFLNESFPKLFRRGVEMLESRALGGSEGAKRRLEDLRSAEGSVWVDLEGGGDVYLTTRDGVVEAVDARPSDPPIRLAVALPREAAEAWLREAERTVDLESEDAAFAAAAASSGRLQQAIGAEGMRFHVIVQDTPDFEEVVVRVGLNAEEPPTEPTFTATVQWDDLEALRTGKLTPQQLLMGGRLRLGGDYSRAMTVAMQVLQEQQAYR